MNPLLRLLQPYPFERLRTLHADTAPNRTKSAINVSIGEPKHPTPALILDALAQGATTGLANYPTTVGSVALREAIAGWLTRRHALRALDAVAEVLPVLGSREALFAFAQTVIDGSRPGATGRRSQSVLSDLRRCCASRRRADVLRERRRGCGICASLGCGARRRLGAHAASLRLLARQPDRQGDAARRMAGIVRPVRSIRLCHRIG
jgi:hypothetical protein